MRIKNTFKIFGLFLASIPLIIGIIIGVISGVLLFIFWVKFLYGWLGILGIILAFIFTPLAVFFPVISWIVEGVFPAFYFILWGGIIIGAIVLALSGSGED